MKRLLLFTMIFIMNSLVIFSQQSILWSENFEENPLSRWSVSSGVWELGVPTSGPNAPHGGLNCAATVLAGNYPVTADTRLLRLAYFTVPAAGDNPRLRFWHWFSFSAGDYGKVQIHVQGTAATEWIDVSPQYVATGSSAWTCPLIELSAYGGQTIQVGFYFHSVDAAIGIDESTGWYIDDVTIVSGAVSINNPESWENGIGNWNVEAGTWEVGTPTSGPGSSHGGSNCAATVLAGNYATSVNSKLISPPIIIPGMELNPLLRFWHWFSFSTGDYGKVMVKIEGNTQWEDLSQDYINTGGGIWSYPAIDLSNYSGKTVRIAFNFHAEDAAIGVDESTGWYIDDVEFSFLIGIEKNSLDNGDLLNIYPNPAHDNFYIEFSNPEHRKYELSFYTPSGNNVLEMQSISDERVEIGKGLLPPGLYLIRLKGDRIFTGKILIE